MSGYDLPRVPSRASATPMRLCAAGNTMWLAYSSSRPDDSFYCPAHQRALFDGFNPQPNQTVRYIDGGRAHVQYVVLARVGDQVRLRPLGRPDAESHYTSVSTLQPDSEAYAAIYKIKGCGK